MSMGNLSAQIQELLCQLGLTANYKGFFYIGCALELCAEQPTRLLLVTKDVYMEVAKRYNTNWRAVERNIRTVGRIIWQKNRLLLESLAHNSLAKQPCTAQLLAILVSSLTVLPLAEHGLCQAVALTGKYHDMRVVNKPVNQGGSQAVIAEHGVPLAEFQI